MSTFLNSFVFSSGSSGPTPPGLDLDDYSGDSPVAAYSLRLISGSYSGSCLRIRRSSDSTEQDIDFDGTGWVDEAAIATFIGGGSGYVVTWYDQSGNGYDLTNSDTAQQPLWDSTGYSMSGTTNGISFDGTDDCLYHENASAVFCTTVQTLHVVAEVESTSYGSLISVSNDKTTSGALVRMNRYGTYMGHYWENNIYKGTVGTQGSPEHLLGYYDGTFHGYNIDDGAYSGQEVHTTNTAGDTLIIGAENTAATFRFPLDCYISEIIMFDATQSSGNIDAVRDDQNSAYTLF